jgi:hypothetical protein
MHLANYRSLTSPIDSSNEAKLSGAGADKRAFSFHGCHGSPLIFTFWAVISHQDDLLKFVVPVSSSASGDLRSALNQMGPAQFTLTG